MTILAYAELLTLVDQGVITGVRKGAINGTSIDVHLAADFLIEAQVSAEPGNHPIVNLAQRESPQLSLYRAGANSGLLLEPGEFVLASTEEVFHMPDDLSAQFLLKSSVARAGLSHALATWADPGWNNSTLTLELHNLLRHHSLWLGVGMPIGQMIFHRHATVPSEASYRLRGRYNNDTNTTAQKL